MATPPAQAAGTTNVPADLAAGCPRDDGSGDPRLVADDEFGDVPYWNLHEHAIDCIVHWGIARGSGGLYRPDEPVTRAQTASLLTNLVEVTGGVLPAESRDRFLDDDGSPHESSIDRLAAAGIVAGRHADRYEPHAPVTREQMAAFLVRTYEHRTGIAVPSPRRATFPDIAASPRREPVEQATSLGVAHGTTTSTDSPATPVRRDQMATFLARTLNLLVEAGAVDVPVRAAHGPPGRGGGPRSVVPAAAYGSYAFIDPTGAPDGGPVRFNPCEPVRVVANLAHAPPGAEDAIAQALDLVSRASGIPVVFEGRTAETYPNESTAFAGRGARIARYGPRWAPVLILWPGEWTSGHDLALATPAYASAPGGWVAVSGVVAVNRSVALTSRQLTAALMHELGHVLGLDHPGDAEQLMDVHRLSPRWGRGDLAGLARVGASAGCQWTPEPF